MPEVPKPLYRRHATTSIQHTHPVQSRHQQFDDGWEGEERYKNYSKLVVTEPPSCVHTMVHPRHPSTTYGSIDDFGHVSPSGRSDQQLRLHRNVLTRYALLRILQATVSATTALTRCTPPEVPAALSSSKSDVYGPDGGE